MSSSAKWPNVSVASLLRTADMLDDPDLRRVVEDGANALSYMLGIARTQQQTIDELTTRLRDCETARAEQRRA